MYFHIRTHLTLAKTCTAPLAKRPKTTRTFPTRSSASALANAKRASSRHLARRTASLGRKTQSLPPGTHSRKSHPLMPLSLPRARTSFSRSSARLACSTKRMRLGRSSLRLANKCVMAADASSKTQKCSASTTTSFALPASSVSNNSAFQSQFRARTWPSYRVPRSPSISTAMRKRLGISRWVTSPCS